jgi:hypothetical protein
MAHDTAVFGTVREQEEMLASRSNLTCYNSAWEKMGTLEPPLPPAILAREGHFL